MNKILRIPVIHIRNGVSLIKKSRNGKFGSKDLCTTTNKTNETTNSHQDSGMTRDEAYRQLQNLDFVTASKMLFTDPPQKKKFGFDFHMVQFFFACMPSLAVYLVAQYARSDMKKMDAELLYKRKNAEEEEKMKEAEAAAVKEKSDSLLANVKERLDALEAVVKEIADETKKITEGKIDRLKDDVHPPAQAKPGSDVSTGVTADTNAPSNVDNGQSKMTPQKADEKTAAASGG